MRNCLPDFFCDVRHKRVEKSENLIKHIKKYLSCILSVLTVTWKSCLNKLNVPVAVAVPDEFINLLNSNAEFKLLKIFVYFFCNCVESWNNPLVLCCESFRKFILNIVVVNVHVNITRCVPELVCKVSASLNTLVGITHIVTGCVACCKEETECVCTVFVNNFKRVDTVAERFWHLYAVFISYNAVHKYGLERSRTHIFTSRENHSCNPEEDDIITCYKSACGIEILKFGSFVGPAKCWERPKCRTEPCIESVLVLMNVCTAALTALFGCVFCNHNFAAVIAVPCRDSVSPPKLTGNTPILDVLHPMEVNLFKSFGDEFCVALAYNINCRLCKRSHFYKPLLWNHRLNCCVTTVASADIVSKLFNLFESADFFKVGNNSLSCLHCCHTCVFSAVENLGFIFGKLSLCL